MFVPIRPRDRRILLLELLFMWDIFRGAGRGGCPNDGGLRRLSRLGGGVGQEVQHATGALGAALLVDGADAPPRRRTLRATNRHRQSKFTLLLSLNYINETIVER